MTGHSVLSRLFAYSRAPTNTPLENFTTEVLAAAIREDQRPFDRSLRAAHPPISPGRVVAVRTQVPTFRSVVLDHGETASGVIDIELQLTTSSIWVEVKVEADLSGPQMRVYRAEADRRGHQLMILAKAPIESADVVTGPGAVVSQARWQDVWDAIRTTPDPSPLWIHLKDFLEERHVADGFDLPIAADELASLGAGYRLFRKVRRTLRELPGQLPERLRWLPWPGEAQANQLVLRQFQNHGRVALTIGDPRSLRVGLGVGPLDRSVATEESPSGALVWIDCHPTQVDLRMALNDMAPGLSEAWATSGAGRWMAWAIDPSPWSADGVSLSGWFIDRIDELATGGLLESLRPADGARPFSARTAPGDAAQDE